MELTKRGWILTFVLSGGFLILYLPNLVNWKYSRMSPHVPEEVQHIEREIRGSSLDGIHVVMVFPLIVSDVWNGLGYNDSSLELRKRRQQEYVDCLRANLNIRTVARIHLFSNQPDLLRIKVVTKYKLNATKIHIHKSNLNPTYRDIFKYVSDFLQNKLVFILNADNFMGESFNSVSLDWWGKSGKMMYALTRHRLKPRPADCQISADGYCDPEGSYLGSHDGFMFYMKGTFPEDFLSELSFSSHAYGSENVVIWAFERKLNFSVKNPCRRLAVYHNHCTDVRATMEYRTRVNVGGKSGVAPFSD
ncbi:uncharacterized protein LOC135477986 isoform X2 [Liolophura sinensis]|uniref:uncharacterized protein LOC135477986 isoform X2 n=1 Tax=Liolophura sinensis TaxID=3198878 RepID=UPI0031592532